MPASTRLNRSIKAFILRDLPASAEGLSHFGNLQTALRMRVLNVDGVTDFTDLTSLTGLDELDVLGPIQSLDGLQAIPTKDLSLSGTDLTDLQNLPPTSDLTNVVLFDNAQLTDISGLSGITSLAELTLNENPLITDLSALSGLSHVTNFNILTMAGLTDLSGLSGLQSSSRLRISQNPALTSLAGLAPLTSVGFLAVASNPVLADASALSSVRGVGQLSVVNNPQLPDLSGFSGLENANVLQISGNALLTDLSGLSGFTDTSLQSLTLSNNPLLTDLTGLASLQTMTGTLQITQNAVLPTLAGLESLTSIGFLALRDNPLLADCSALSVAYTSGSIGGTPSIANNAPGCNAATDLGDSDGDGVPDAFDVCPGWDDADDADGDGIPAACDEFPLIAEGSILPGSNVAVDATTNTGASAPVALTFGEVTASGHVVVDISATGPTLPSGFQLGTPPVYFDVTTTATYTGAIESCFDYSAQTFTDEPGLRLFHDDGTGWADVTTSLDTTNDIICGTTTSLSPFVVVEPEPIVGEILFNAGTLVGSFTDPRGDVHEVRLALDAVRYRDGSEHQVWLKPEDYKVDKGTWTKILNCPTDGPGVKAVAEGAEPAVTCTWKDGPGNRPSGTVELELGAPELSPSPPRFKAFRPERTTLDGSFVDEGVTYEVSLVVDMVDYRNGNRHKAWTRDEGRAIDQGGFPGTIVCEGAAGDGAGARIVHAGSRPEVSCVWRIGSGVDERTGTFEMR